MNITNLFDPCLIGDIELKNRIVMAPMTRSRSDNEEHAATELTAKYYGQRATAGLIVTRRYSHQRGCGWFSKCSGDI